jgi:hypothetical protein
MTSKMMIKRLVYLCAWLPPDFGAVGNLGVAYDGWDNVRQIFASAKLARSQCFGA